MVMIVTVMVIVLTMIMMVMMMTTMIITMMMMIIIIFYYHDDGDDYDDYHDADYYSYYYDDEHDCDKVKGIRKRGEDTKQILNEWALLLKHHFWVNHVCDSVGLYLNTQHPNGMNDEGANSLQKTPAKSSKKHLESMEEMNIPNVGCSEFDQKKQWSNGPNIRVSIG